MDDSFRFGLTRTSTLICLLWFDLFMSDYQRITLWSSQWTDQSVRLCCATMSVGLWCAGVDHRDDGRLQAHADRPGEVKDECLVLVADGSSSRVTSYGG